MVDFQSRDTRRGPVTDDDEDGDEEADRHQDGEPADDDAPTGSDSAGGQMEGEQSAASTDEGAERARSDADADADADPLAESDPTPAATGDADAIERESAPTAKTASGHQPAEPARTIDVAVVTVGEGSEAAVVEGFESAGHTITTRERLQGDYDGLQRSVDTLVSRDDVDAVVTTGGIGIGAGEVTIEAVHPLFEKALPGFGEAFRTLLYDVIGTGIVAVRSAAGVADGTLVFCLPADAEAAGLAVEEILVTEAPELAAHLDE